MEGLWLRNAFRWKETVGAWEERPGHFGDVWNYWTDDGLGLFEFFQVRISFFFDIFGSVYSPKFKYQMAKKNIHAAGRRYWCSSNMGVQQW